MKKSVYLLTRISLLIACIAVLSQLAIPLPTGISITLQTFAVFICAILLGAKYGSITVILYLLLGIVGIPVFSGLRAGAGIVLGATGGYLLGLLPTAFLTGFLTQKFGYGKKSLVFAMSVGLLACYISGSVWYWIFFTEGSAASLFSVIGICVLPYIVPDIIKIFAVAFLTKPLKKLVNKF